MARYTGPVCRLCRREGMKLFLKGEKCLTKCTFERRSSPPGMHQQRRRKVSDFALQLREKQKARRIYGVLERQMKNTFDQAAEIKGATGEVMLQNLERRLDNTVYRAGFGKSRSQARQPSRDGKRRSDDLGGERQRPRVCLQRARTNAAGGSRGHDRQTIGRLRAIRE